MVVKFKWELTYKTYLIIIHNNNIGLLIVHNNYSLQTSRTEVMQCSHYIKCVIKHDWSYLIHLIRCDNVRVG